MPLPVLFREEMDINFLRENRDEGQIVGTENGTMLGLKLMSQLSKTLLCFGRFVWCDGVETFLKRD